MRLFKKQNHEDPRRYVLIPIVKPGNNDVAESSSINDQLIEVYTQPYTFGDDTDNRAIDKDWDRVAATLRKAKLYDSGCVATSAVHKLGLKKPKMAIYQWLKPQAWLEKQRLYLSYPEYSVEGNSAELGLALVLLMAASGSPYRQVIATGALRGKNGQTQLLREHDVKVWPVGKLEEKLKLVIQKVEKGELLRDKNLLFFIPKYYNQGETRIEVESLPEVQTLRALGIQVVPIEWLSEAAEQLKADTARYLPQDLILKWFIITLLVISLSWSSWVGWRDRAIEMEFLKPRNTFTFAEPYLVCDIKNQPLEKAHNPVEIKRNKETYLVPTINSTLGWQVKLGQANSFDTLLNRWMGYQGYYVAAIGVSESKILPEILIPRKKEKNGIVRIPPGENWRRYVKIKEVPNTTVILILVAQRYEPIDSDEIIDSIKQFKQTITTTTNVGEPDIRTITDFILSQFPSGLLFRFKTVEEKLECSS